MILRKLIRFCTEELDRTARYVAAAYEALRELDEMTLATLKMYLRDR
ncbi:MAG TPA: hypothetical protein VNU84_06300 [Candidatus Acidoferrum sp.]|nr:hypothetical protein [Candidatus Acidoferrum sp.]